MVSVASHLTFLSRQASQLGSFLLWRYARFWACELDEGNWWPDEGPGVPDTESLDGRESRPPMVKGVAVAGVYEWNDEFW